MSNLQIFNSDQFGQVRVKEKDGEIWFVAKDICKALDIKDHKQSTRYLDDDEKGMFTIHTPGGQQEMTAVNEPGMYQLVLRSRKPEAKKFKRWITHEVLPKIRKTGQYSVQPKSQLDILRQAIDEIEAAQQEAREAKQIATATQEEIETTKHRVDNLDAVNLEGDLRQRLNKMVRKYAWQEGLDYRRAWQHFKQNFNTAYNTNIGLLQTNHFKETGKELSIPGILEERNLLEDAVRVADKMLN